MAYDPRVELLEKRIKVLEKTIDEIIFVYTNGDEFDKDSLKFLIIGDEYEFDSDGDLVKK